MMDSPLDMPIYQYDYMGGSLADPTKPHGALPWALQLPPRVVSQHLMQQEEQQNQHLQQQNQHLQQQSQLQQQQNQLDHLLRPQWQSRTLPSHLPANAPQPHIFAVTTPSHSSIPPFASPLSVTLSSPLQSISQHSIPSSSPQLIAPHSFQIPIAMDSQSQPNSPSQQQQQQQQQQQNPDPEQSLLQSEIAAQQAAARDWRPQHEGPLVATKASTQVVVDEYQNGHETFRIKTAALPQTYSHIRKIRGDGNCGWRAIAYGYFETLANLGDPGLIEREEVRLKSLDNYISKFGGFDLSILCDMTEMTISLLRQIKHAPNAHDIIHDAFNNEMTSAQIIFHMRLLASSQMKCNPDMYSGFLPDVFTYCKNVIEVIDQEIEHFGFTALFEILLRPIDFVLEIAYIDLTPDPMSIYSWPETAKDQDPATLGPVISLLFRPNHYDLVYRVPPPPVVPDLPLEVHRAMAFNPHSNFVDHLGSMHTYSTFDFNSPLAMIPGLTMHSTDSSPLFGMNPAISSAPPPPMAQIPQSPVGIPVELGFASVPPQPAVAPSMPPPQSPIGGPAQSPVVELGFALSAQPQSSPNGCSPTDLGFTPVSTATAASPADSWAASPTPVSSPDGWSGSPHPVFSPVVMAGTSAEPVIPQQPLGVPRAIAPQPQLMSRTGHMMAPASGMYPIRFGKEVWNLNLAPSPEPTCKNSIFKNSPYNRAHFSNPQFHPEQYVPGDDAVDRRETKRRAKAKAEREAREREAREREAKSAEVKDEPTQ